MTGVIPFAQFAGVDHPVSLVLQSAGQNWVAGIIDIGAVLGMTTVMLVMLYGQTRVMFAMSRDGLLPGSLSKVHPKHKTRAEKRRHRSEKPSGYIRCFVLWMHFRK